MSVTFFTRFLPDSQPSAASQVLLSPGFAIDIYIKILLLKDQTSACKSIMNNVFYL